MGNMTKSGEYDFEYDASGRMKKAYHLASLVGEYRYNAAGQRVGKNGQRVYVYGLSGELIGEYQSDGTPVSEVVYADGMRIAEYRDIKTPPPPLPRGPQGYNISRDAGYATEDRTFIKATDTLYCRVWADTVDPGQVTVKEAKLNIGSNVYTWQLTYDSGAHEWKGSKVLSGVSLTPGNFWTFTATVSDSLGHTYSPSTTVTVSTGAWFPVGVNNVEIDSVTANNCDTNGLVRVEVRGRHFQQDGSGYAVDAVSFGGMAAVAFSITGNTAIRVTVPARYFPGKADVRVGKNMQGGGRSEAVLPCSFTYRWPTSGANLLYYHNDHLGTPAVLTNKQGTMVWRGEHLPFGEIDIQETDPDGNGIHLTTPFRFPGQYFDEETGLHYNYFRYYGPGLGGYIQGDPIGQNGGANEMEGGRS